MKAVIFAQHGGPENLEYTEVPDPSVGAGELLLRVKACALNHLDIWVRQGLPAYRINLPHISGCDVAGVVERVGSGVRNVRAGDPVVLAPGLCCGDCEWCRAGQESLCASYGIRGAATDGGYAELVSAKASDAIPLPKGLAFEVAAAYPLVFLTAWHMLVTRARLQPGETVLVHAAGSGVGHAAVQIAKHLKARVFTTVGSDAKLKKALALGVDEAINYQQEDFLERVRELTQKRGVDVVCEHIGSQIWEKNIRVLAKGGRLVTCGATTGPTAGLDLRFVFSRQLTILGSMMGSRAELDEVTKLVAKRVLKPVVDTVFPLKKAREAQERMFLRDVFGKLVLQPPA